LQIAFCQCGIRRACVHRCANCSDPRQASALRRRCRHRRSAAPDRRSGRTNIVSAASAATATTAESATEAAGDERRVALDHSRNARLFTSGSDRPSPPDAPSQPRNGADLLDAVNDRARPALRFGHSRSPPFCVQQPSAALRFLALKRSLPRRQRPRLPLRFAGVLHARRLFARQAKVHPATRHLLE